jgi:membrane protein implicated in regulation of membrane protease activity
MRDVQAWQAWLGLAVLLGVLELLSMDLVLVMLALGALAGTLTALGTDAVWVQALVAAGATAATLTLVRPSVVRRLHAGPTLETGPGRLVGTTGVVVEQVSAGGGGQIRIGGNYWRARPYDDQEVIDVGAVVDVFAIEGATALVHPVPRLD